MKAFAPIIASLVCCLHFSSAIAADDTPFVPSNPPEMTRLRDTNSPAHQAAKHFMRGVNLGNYLEAPRGNGWGVIVSPQEFWFMKDEGFDHVRIPVKWSDYVDRTGGYQPVIREPVILPAPADNQQSTSSNQPPPNEDETASPEPVVNIPLGAGPGNGGILPHPVKRKGSPKSNVQPPVQNPGGSGRNLQQRVALSPHYAATAQAPVVTAQGHVATAQGHVATPQPAYVQIASGADSPRQVIMTVEQNSSNNFHFEVEPGIFARVDFAVTNALNAGLAVILNMHHFDDFTTDPLGQSNKFLAIWEQVAAHYASFPPTLAFELLNEPKDAATTKVINPIFAQAISIIRRTNPRRTIFVGPGMWNQASELKNLVLPNNDNNLIVTVHCYQPFYFTHQGATWAGPDVKPLKNIQFPGPPAEPLVLDPKLKFHPWVTNWISRYNTLPADQNPSSPLAFEKELRLARQWGDYYGRPVHVGEFGCFTTADPESRARFYTAFRQECDTDKLGWAIWDWSAGFRYWDKKKNQPMPGMHEALFGKDED